MKFQFENWSDFLLMDGHGVYVWIAAMVTILIMSWLIISPLMSLRQFKKDFTNEASLDHAKIVIGEDS